MDNSVRPTIEKIKLQEQDNEARLREKREINAAIVSLNRGILDTSMNIEKLSKEHQSLVASTDKLEHELLIERTRHSAITDQVNSCRKELDELRKTSVKGVSSVWQKRSTLFETVQEISDKCDIWALFIKPQMNIEIKSNIIAIEKRERIIHDDSKLQAAIERKNKAIAMRNFLLTEPDNGEEFIRTRNALQYSMEIMANEENNI